VKKLRLTRERRQRFLTALAETGIVSAAVTIAATSRTRVYELRKRDAGFAAARDEAEERSADSLEAEAWRRGVDGVPEPLVSAGKLVCDDDGQPLAIRRYSDHLLLALLKARRPEKFKDRAVVEHDVSDNLVDRLEAARQRALAASPAIQLERKEDMKRRGLASPDNGPVLPPAGQCHQTAERSASKANRSVRRSDIEAGRDRG
jgi:hypothetical protein